MKVLTAGNLGDIIIQACVLKCLNLKIDGVIAPANYLQIANEVFDLEEGVVPLKKEISDGRLATFAGFRRDELFKFVENRLKLEVGENQVCSLVFSEEDVFRRSENIYKAYFDLIAKRLSIEIPPNVVDSIQPFAHLPKGTDRNSNSRRIIVCPVGGIKVKELSREVLGAISNFCIENKYELVVLLSEFDFDPFVGSGISYQELRIKTGKNFLKSACNEFMDSAMIVSIDTAWYHLASIQGFEVLPIPGPRSLEHFQFPKSVGKFNYKNTLACFDCFSSHSCVVNGYSVCKAKPTSNEIVDKLQMAIGKLSHIDTGVNRFTFKVIEPDQFKLRLFFYFIEHIMPVLGRALQFKRGQFLFAKCFRIASRLEKLLNS